jgi:hypothetical protein
MRIPDLVAWVERSFGRPPDMINYGSAMLYNSFAFGTTAARQAARNALALPTAIAELTHTTLPRDTAVLELQVLLQDSDQDLPPLRYHLAPDECAALQA